MITFLINIIYSELYYKYIIEENGKMGVLMIYLAMASKLKDICTNFIPKRENLEIIYAYQCGYAKVISRKKNTLN